MKIKPVFLGEIVKVDGIRRFIWENETAVRQHLSKFEEGTQIQILIEKRKRIRSQQQNRYYWGCVIDLLCEGFGWLDPDGPEEMHEYLKMKFLAKQRGPITTSRSSASLTTIEFEEYMSLVRSWASLEHSIYIPEPNEPSIQAIYFR